MKNETGMPAVLWESAFMKACRREPVDRTPVWLMRQAGRYMREYRDLRAKVSFLELCKTPELAAEATLTAQRRLDVDAAIIFADILLPLEPMGIGVEFTEDRGPQMLNPIREPEQIDRLRDIDPKDDLSFVMEALRLTRRDLPENVPLIGFCGAPFTLASYLIEGGGSKNFVRTREFMFRHPEDWNRLLSKLSGMLAVYLNEQAKAGAQALQVFDSWVGHLGPDEYREFVAPHSKNLISNVTPGVPVIHFGYGSSPLLDIMREAGGDVMGVDYHIHLDKAWSLLGDEWAVQGNLDPCALFAERSEVLSRAQRILDRAAGRPGHIFNLGHGILPRTPVDNVIALVEYVHERTAAAAPKTS